MSSPSGERATATQRLNLSQAFNPLGSLSGMAVASVIVLPQLWSDRRDAAGQILFHSLPEAEKAVIRQHDLAVIRDPYVIIGLVVVMMFVIIALLIKETSVSSSPMKAETGRKGASATLRRLWHNRIYREGVAAQMCYVAAQIMVWTFIIQYADYLGIDKATAQTYNIVAMVLFLCSRFVCTFLMRYVSSRTLLVCFAAGAALCSVGTIAIVGHAGLYCLVGISFFMSLMFPTIYGIALEDVVAEDTSLGAAFLVMAIVGGALMPPLQGVIIDQGMVLGHPAVNVSYVLPLLCFVAVGLYGWRAANPPHPQG